MLALALRQSVRREPIKKAAKLRIPDWDDAAVRKAIQDEKGPLFIAPRPRRGWTTWRRGRTAPRRTTWRGWASPSPTRLDAGVAAGARLAGPTCAPLAERDRRGAEAARSAPLIVSGTGCGSEAVMQAAANVAWALRTAGRPCAALPRPRRSATASGLALLGGDGLDAACRGRSQEGGRHGHHPGERPVPPRRTPPSVDALPGGGRQRHRPRPHRDTPHGAQGGRGPARRHLRRERRHASSTTRGARSASSRCCRPDGDIQESWRWLRDMGGRGRHGTDFERWANVDDVDGALAAALPVFAPVPEIAPPAGFRIAGRRIAAPAAPLQRAHGDARATSTSTSRSRRTTRTRRWPSRWKATRASRPRR